MKKGVTSTVIIAILVVINLYVVIVGFLPLNFEALLDGTETHLQDPDGMTLMLGAITLGVALLAFVGWAALITVTHALCIVFTLRNRKSAFRAIRIINIVLDLANAFLIIAPIVKIIIWTH